MNKLITLLTSATLTALLGCATLQPEQAYRKIETKGAGKNYCIKSRITPEGMIALLDYGCDGKVDIYKIRKDGENKFRETRRYENPQWFETVVDPLYESISNKGEQ